ncbi:sulfurtransferase complex subunit TusB [Buchnera aphidicola]|uniref:Protein TusB n=1 Tax=Buchnera aphidicola str. USDA (Myzus persicae) TaxID=1009856 RepID=W0P349_BUCMP|nr:sulfurtransferase complex subunit TusB [Buchnera aphidicola]AHG59872.1 Yhel [Buchnera aphidicola str. USDA (Myzus persicae)]AHG60452.1 Yhel [Buchnera aphidicola str. W106 (Myzus persicae)]AHG61025.1 Yhel [Buchnera aphidicola str. G002 (Myzus persicae)]AHG61597.1 Yhel [Buchnera aphidicola str. F009 (Myzus persicae)]WAI02889.1 MAG: sulfurtransferase complex subunit TusB [Buchnera aphidicola (Myzus persicae)]
MLHTLMKSPFEINIDLVISMLRTSDDFLALQDGVLIGLKDNIFLKNIVMSSAKLYIIKEDVYARGIHKNISSKFILISYIHFVSLTLKHQKQMAW